ncbi:MAG: nuclease family protein [Schlesneria sp.]|nr:nuclease family protein [Schlesneria sp.]
MSDGETMQWLNDEKFVIHKMSDKWEDVGGVYIFAQFDREYWFADYVGETESFAEHLPNHERWPDAVRCGSTHVHTLVVDDKTSRRSLGEQLIQRYRPPMNTPEPSPI